MELRDSVAKNLLNSLAKINYFSDDELYEFSVKYSDSISIVLDYLCNTEITKFYELDETSVYYLRKRLGLFNNGKLVHYNSIDKNINNNVVTYNINNSLNRISDVILYEVEYLSTLTIDQISVLDIKALCLSSKYNTYLRRAGINTLGDLLNKTEYELLSVRGLGIYTYNTIIRKLNSLNLSLNSSHAIDAKDDILNMKIEYLNLSNRAFNCLKRTGINTIRDLTIHRMSDLLLIKNMGKILHKEIVDKVNSLGLSFAPELEHEEKNEDSVRPIDNFSDLLRQYKQALRKKDSLEYRLEEVNKEIEKLLNELGDDYKEYDRYRK